MKNKQHIQLVTHAHSNLTSWSAVKALLEGGIFYGSRPQKAHSKILKIVNTEIRRELEEYDTETEIVLES